LENLLESTTGEIEASETTVVKICWTELSRLEIESDWVNNLCDNGSETFM
jgi:hypothetical protein